MVNDLRDDFAEYIKCEGCNAPLLNCDCNCPRCGKREKCVCELSVITAS